MEVAPLTSLNALLTWKYPENLKEFLKSLAQLAPKSPSVDTWKHSTAPSPHFRTLVCHDFKGGYLDDRFCNGTQKMDAYRFYHWAAIDTFVYFSHHFITIPPRGWVHAAHIHGVKVLGTLITEWDIGESLCDTMLADDVTIESALNNLVDIACTYNFDGWLVNIENKIKPEKVQSLIYFVGELTKRMHHHKPHAEVIWYDSMTKDGELKWQNELNEKNESFFDVCDGIFLNYSWKEENLKKSVVAAGQRLSDVYVGVDVFGRNFWEGGGFNCHKALKVIREYNLSAAIFAQGWIYETLGSENFFTNNNKLWATLEQFLLYHGPTQLPFRTSFCQGFGKNVYRQGKIVEKGNWYNLSRQQTQPNWEEFSRSTSSLFSVNTDAAFNGGSCLVMWVDGPTSVRMMVCQFPLHFPLEVTFAYRVVGNVKTLSFVFDLDQKRNSESSLSDSVDEPSEVSFIAEGESKGEGEGESKAPKNSSDNEILPENKETVNEWIVKRYILSSRKGWISSFSLKMEGPGLVMFGEVSVEKLSPAIKTVDNPHT